ncbi:MAG: sugar ABC transporter ATP-binding protein, partial [Acidobacteriota bacterium]|nr:sugar ABC transporter ATP-binding protein [Acidobacteriota bacterium]
YYGGQTALTNVNFHVRSGAVNVLIGENGAGKSTLMRLLAGAEQPSEGQIVMEGRTLQLRSPRDASAEGISIVHQDLSVLDNLDVAENIFAGRELVRAGILVDRHDEEQRSGTALRHIGMPMDAHAMQFPAGDLSLGCRQLVEVARSLAHRAKILILDEPTSALSSAEANILYRVVEDLKSRGVAIIYISHRLHELLHLGDYFTVLRDGQVVGEGERGAVDRTWIVERMSGRSADAALPRRASLHSTEQVLEVVKLGVRQSGRPAVKNVSFTVGKGEVVGIYGLLGSGRTELMEALAGLRRPETGVVKICGKPAPLGNIAATIRSGITLAPEDRQKDGLVPDLSIRENISLASLADFSHRGFLNRTGEIEKARRIAAQVRISATDLELPVTTLSGGNQQKVVLGRCLMRNPSVLLLDEPTRGVDVSAKADIYSVLRDLASKGLSILFTSSEIEETQLLADRVLVLARGSISAEFTAAELTDAALFAAASPAVEVNA